MNITSIQPKYRAIAVLLVQAALVLSVAGKYLYERKTSPRVWVRTAQYDPNLACAAGTWGCELRSTPVACPTTKTTPSTWARGQTHGAGM